MASPRQPTQRRQPRGHDRALCWRGDGSTQPCRRPAVSDAPAIRSSASSRLCDRLVRGNRAGDLTWPLQIQKPHGNHDVANVAWGIRSQPAGAPCTTMQHGTRCGETPDIHVLKLWNESRTNRARIADSPPVRVRSRRHLAGS